MPLRFANSLLIATLAATPAWGAFDAPAEGAGPARQVELARSSVWQAFRARHGSWAAVWNERTRTPHLAAGPAIPLSGFRDDRAGADRAVRGFVESHGDLFGAPALELASAVRAGQVWYLSYRQSVRGIPVLFEDWEFRVSAAGRLMAFRADAHRVGLEVETSPVLSPAAASAAAQKALGLRGEATTGAPGLALLPVESSAGTDYALVYSVETRSSSPPKSWLTLVDAATGAVRWNHDRVRHAISGNVVGDVHPDLPSQPVVQRRFANAKVAVGADTLITDSAGAYHAASASGTVTVASQLRGLYCDVTRFDDVPDASWSSLVTDPATADIAWSASNSLDAERDVYYHINYAHDWLKTLNPGFTALDFVLPCGINLGGGCDALWDGFGLYFFSSGIQCPGIASMSDVVYHEYGHAMTDRLYAQLGQSFGMINGALHEGLSDALSCFLRDDPVVGRDFLGPGTTLRTLDNSRVWPKDGSPADQQSGLIVGGALWDLRESLGLPMASRLAHFALYGKPDAANDGQAMAEFFVETLVADDDNGNLADGTPHDDTILSIFNARGIGTGHFLTILQPEPEDRPFAGPYAVTATILTSSPIGAVSGASVFYSVNGGPYLAVPMTAVGGDEYSASLPAPQGSIVRYYIRASDTVGGARNEPAIELEKTHLFFTGTATLVVMDEAELPFDWSIGWDDDSAAGGVWAWGEPNGTTVGLGIQCQPEADHSPAGIMCFFTGQAMVGSPPGTNDVDGGATTLFTEVFSASLAGPDPVVEYYRWFSNDLSTATVDDRWRVWVSNDLGASWVPVEDTPISDNSWRRVAFFLRDYVTPNDQIVLRFAAEDVGVPSLVEAAVDDVHIWRFDVPRPGPEPPVSSLAIAASPNPFDAETRLAFSLPRAGVAEMTVLDVQGRRVRSLVSGTLEAGPHSVAWDGQNDDGRRAASGLYLVRLESEGSVVVRRLVRIR